MHRIPFFVLLALAYLFEVAAKSHGMMIFLVVGLGFIIQHIWDVTGGNPGRGTLVLGMALAGLSLDMHFHTYGSMLAGMATVGLLISTQTVRKST